MVVIMGVIMAVTMEAMEVMEVIMEATEVMEVIMEDMEVLAITEVTVAMEVTVSEVTVLEVTEVMEAIMVGIMEAIMEDTMEVITEEVDINMNMLTVRNMAIKEVVMATREAVTATALIISLLTSVPKGKANKVDSFPFCVYFIVIYSLRYGFLFTGLTPYRVIV